MKKPQKASIDGFIAINDILRLHCMPSEEVGYCTYTTEGYDDARVAKEAGEALGGADIGKGSVASVRMKMFGRLREARVKALPLTDAEATLADLARQVLGLQQSLATLAAIDIAHRLQSVEETIGVLVRRVQNSDDVILAFQRRINALEIKGNTSSVGGPMVGIGVLPEHRT